MGASVLETAVANLRFGMSMMLGRPFHRHSLERIVAAVGATLAEFGTIGDGDDLLGGVALDVATRRIVQGRRLRTLARRAARDTDHYRRLFRDLAIDPDSFGFDDLARLPILSKADLRSYPDDFVRAGSRPCHRITTTGTTGRPATVWFSDDEWYLFGTLATIGAATGRQIEPDDVVQISISPRNQLGVQALQVPSAVVGATVHVAGMPPPEQTLALLAERRRPPVNVMSIHPSYLGELVTAARVLGYRPSDFGLERVLLGGEVTTDGLLRRAGEVFGDTVDFLDIYGISELAPFGAIPCGAGHLHYEPTVCVVEVQDLSAVRPAEIAEPGVLVGTPLPPFRDTTLLLRYNTEDVVVRLPDELDCPLRRLPAFSRPLGKRSLAVQHTTGWTFVRDVAEALEHLDVVPLPARYGLRPADGGVSVEAVTGSTDQAVRRAVGAALEGAGVPLRRLRLVTDPTEISDPAPLRCDAAERAAAATAARDRSGRL